MNADYNAPDWGGNPGGSQVPLMDFFGPNKPRPFVTINTDKWVYTCFTNTSSCGLGTYTPQDPDAY